MPIKFKCGCGHLLTVPDSAAGKTGKCPKCQKSLRVPAPKASSSGGARTEGGAAKAPTQGAASAPGGGAKGSGTRKANAPGPVSGGAAALPAGKLDSLFDEMGLTKRTGPVCPQCGTDIKRGAVVCTKCGLNFESGERMIGFDAIRERPEFENPFLQEASNNMVRDMAVDLRRDRSTMPWWVLMSYLIGAITLCGAGVVIVDGKFGTPDDASTFIGTVQRFAVFTTLGVTVLITGLAITFFAHLSISFYAFTQNIGQGLACFLLPILYSFPYGVMHWSDNKAPVKALFVASILIGLGAFLITQGDGFDAVSSAMEMLY